MLAVEFSDWLAIVFFNLLVMVYIIMFYVPFMWQIFFVKYDGIYCVLFSHFYSKFVVNKCIK